MRLDASELVAISTSTNTVKGRVHLAAPCYGEAITADGKFALAAVTANQLAVVDLQQMSVAGPFSYRAAHSRC